MPLHLQTAISSTAGFLVTDFFTADRFAADFFAAGFFTSIFFTMGFFTSDLSTVAFLEEKDLQHELRESHLGKLTKGTVVLEEDAKEIGTCVTHFL